MPEPTPEETRRWRGLLDALVAARAEEAEVKAALDEARLSLERGGALRAEAEALAARKASAEAALAASVARTEDLRRRIAALEARR